MRAARIEFAIGLLVLVAGHISFGQGPNPPDQLNAQVASAIQHLKAGDLDTAERLFSEALRHGGRSAVVVHNLGVIAQQRGNHEVAITRFREAIQLQPDYAPSHLLLGSSLLSLGRNKEAIPELMKAVKWMPDQPAARLELAKGFEASGNWVQAVPQLQKLVELDPGNAEYSYRLGRAFGELSGWCLRELALHNPGSARLQQAQAQGYALQGKYDLALEAYERAVHSDPKLPELHLGMALMLLQLKRVDEALEQINLELSLVPESKTAADTKARIIAAKELSTR